MRRASLFNLPRNAECNPLFQFTAPPLPTLRPFTGKQPYTPRMRRYCNDPYLGNHSNNRKNVASLLLSPTSKSFQRLPSASSSAAVHIQRELRATPRLTPTYIYTSRQAI